jgi:hypothetical protein
MFRDIGYVFTRVDTKHKIKTIFLFVPETV